MDFLSKQKLEDYTEADFLRLLREFFENPNRLKGAALEAHLTELSQHFVKLVDHPKGTDLIFYPEARAEDSPEGVLSVVKEWRAKQGLPGFKS